MKIRSIAFAATLTAVAAWPTLLSAESPSHDRQTITPAFKETIPDIPGKSLVGLVVTYPPGGATPGAFPSTFRLRYRLRAHRLDPKPGRSWQDAGIPRGRTLDRADRGLSSHQRERERH
jgi:hypothetical protein